MNREIELADAKKVDEEMDPEALYWLGHRLIDKQDYLSAINCLQKGLTVEPHNAKFLNELGYAYGQLGQARRALESYETVLNLSDISDHDKAVALRGSASKLIDLQRWIEAKLRLNESLELEPDSDVAPNELTYIAQHEHDGEWTLTKDGHEARYSQDGRLIAIDGCKNPEDLWNQAEAGDLDAWYTLGLIYADKFGEAYDPVRAVACYRYAAVREHPGAMNNLGNHLFNGEGIAQDLGAALKIIHAAALKGNVAALFTLGILHEQGLGGDSHLRLAREWMQCALAAGHPDAQEALDRLNASGA